MKPEPIDTEFAEPVERKPLEIFYDAERSMRTRTVSAIVPMLPPDLATNLETVSQKADRSIGVISKIDFATITDAELKTPRILVGLTFVGFSSLMMMFLSLFLSTIHPELSPANQIYEYWHQFAWLVCLGVAGLTVLGREAMRSARAASQKEQE